MTKTRHTCGGPAFGRLTVGCPRCDELANGAAPRKQAWRQDRQFAKRQAVIRALPHNCTTARCGVVCTFGEW